jgi:RNA polymerase sigma-70 factor (ECF subfamily)
MRTTEGLSGYEIEAVKAGNVHAFEVLYNKYKRIVYALCLRGTKDVADAEDLTQEVFLQVHLRVSSLRNGAAFNSWLFRVTTNIILMHSRRRRVFPISLHCILGAETSAGVDVIQALISPLCEPIERLALVRAIGDLPKCRRTVLVLHDIKGMNHREIAASLGVSLNTAKSNLSRAHHQLRKILRRNASATSLPATCGGAPQEHNDGAQRKTHGLRIELGRQMSVCQPQSAA